VTRHRWLSIGRRYLGPIAAGLALCSTLWLLSFYVHARLVTPGEMALVDSLKVKAKTDADIQKVLQPELVRQHDELVRRGNAYNRGGVVLLLSLGTWLTWIKWLRPKSAQWGGMPQGVVKYLEWPVNGPVEVGTPSASAPGLKVRPTADSHKTRPAHGQQLRLEAGLEPGDPRLPTERRIPNPESRLQTRQRGSLGEDDPVGHGAATGAGGISDMRPGAPIDLAPVDRILASEGRAIDSVIPILQAIQAHYHYLPDAALRRVCEHTSITPPQIAGVASFYRQFRLTPTGEHVIRVCEGTACHVSGADEVRTELRRCLGMAENADTDPTGAFTVDRVACIGSCSLAPVVTIDDRVYAHVSGLSAGRLIRDVVDGNGSLPVKGRRRRGRPRARLGAPAGGASQESTTRRRAIAPIEFRIGLGSCGIASGAEQVLDALEDEVASLGGGATIKAVGCSGLCHSEPLVEVVGNGRPTMYGRVEPDDVRRLVRRHVQPRGVVRRVREGVRDTRARMFDDRAWTPVATREIDVAPYVSKQVRIVLENCGSVDPLSLDDYRGRDGMRALEVCLTRLTPDEVIAQIRASGLRGRGGAGFPTASKWDLTRRASGPVKYVICNGDEGDPGAFMDRAVMEGDPFRVIEGMMIAAYAVGASEGVVYVRREYPLAVRHMRAAIDSASADGLLGDRILDSPFSFRLRLREGAGAFVCGEETALIHSLEGKRGMPRPRPPYPAQSGLWGQPTLINNVETLATVPWILRRGPEAFAALGTETSKGTKVFSLAGKIARGGLIEVPMGITIREIVEDVGGGVKGGRPFKAVLAGGPSGGCIPAHLADTRIDYEDLACTGAIMGSGGLVILDDRDCVVEIARYFLNFTQEESCGKCTFCRVGTRRMLEILDRICAGQGEEGDLQALDDLSIGIKHGSLCGLGQTAPNPVLTTLRYFREEYEAHIRERRCPAAVCKALIHYRVLDTCTGCTLCAQACPAGAIESRPYLRHEVADDLCTRCGMCVNACPENAIEVA
jgi:NADH-quinone oxidoreductase subunit F